MKQNNMIKTVRGSLLNATDKYLKLPQDDLRTKMEMCPLCSNPGKRVLQVTVSTHVYPEDWKLLFDGFRFCSDTICPMIYYNNATETYFLKSEIKTKFGLKEENDPKPICYCLSVLEEDIRYEIMKKNCCDSLQDIEEYTKAGTGKWCLTTNPSGKCCRDYLGDVVDKFLKMKESAGVKPLLRKVKQDLEEMPPEKQVSLSVKGMTCNSCVTHVSSVIEKMGGKDISVSLEKEAAVFLLPTITKPDEVAVALTESGYESNVVDQARKK